MNKNLIKGALLYNWKYKFEADLVNNLTNNEISILKGYIFGEWYKEPECITPWDFDSATVPKKIYTAEYVYLFNETKLYAKWYKIYN